MRKMTFISKDSTYQTVRSWGAFQAIRHSPASVFLLSSDDAAQFLTTSAAASGAELSLTMVDVQRRPDLARPQSKNCTCSASEMNCSPTNNTSPHTVSWKTMRKNQQSKNFLYRKIKITFRHLLHARSYKLMQLTFTYHQKTKHWNKHSVLVVNYITNTSESKIYNSITSTKINLIVPIINSHNPTITNAT